MKIIPVTRLSPIKKDKIRYTTKKPENKQSAFKSLLDLKTLLWNTLYYYLNVEVISKDQSQLKFDKARALMSISEKSARIILCQEIIAKIAQKDRSACTETRGWWNNCAANQKSMTYNGDV